MKRVRPLWVMWVLVALLFAALPVVGQVEMIEPNLYFHNVWARATATEDTAAGDVLDVSAVYLAMANAGGIGVRLIAAESPLVPVVEIHETLMSGDVMSMQPVEGGIDVLAGEVVWLEPGALHIMLMGLTEPLIEGEAVPLTLTYLSLDDAGQPTGDPWTIELAAPVMNEAPVPSDFVFSGVWARPADAGTTSAAYFNLLNVGGAEDTLIGASTDVAGLVEIHTMIMNGEVMEMRPLEGGLTVAPGDIAVLEPGGIHVMLMNLPDALEEGTAFSLTLHFASGADITIGVPVYDRMMMQMGGM